MHSKNSIFEQFTFRSLGLVRERIDESSVDGSESEFDEDDELSDLSDLDDTEERENNEDSDEDVTSLEVIRKRRKNYQRLKKLKKRKLKLVRTTTTGKEEANASEANTTAVEPITAKEVVVEDDSTKKTSLTNEMSNDG